MFLTLIRHVNNIRELEIQASIRNKKCENSLNSDKGLLPHSLLYNLLLLYYVNPEMT